MEIFEDHNPKAKSYWLPLLAGQITAVGAPSIKRLRSWGNLGVSDVVTLLRGDEMQKWLPGTCASLGIHWHHFPLSGKNLSDPLDIETLARIPQIVSLLQQNKNIVIHCAAGLHRTGVFLYFLLRNMGLETKQILESIEQIREITALELSKKTKKGILMEKAEALYRQIFSQEN